MPWQPLKWIQTMRRAFKRSPCRPKAILPPLKGNFDLTYRCNNNCLHCWLRAPDQPGEIKKELSFEEIKRIISQARALGCQSWGISGGEPMLRRDFVEILDYINHNSIGCAINTNGTLITPEIAKLLKTPGKKMIALYGATARVHDRITRTPGSFEATMRGISYLKEAKVAFVMQLIMMQENYPQLRSMVELSLSLAQSYRFGAPWLNLCAYKDEERNKEILRQRLPPEKEVEMDAPDIGYLEDTRSEDSSIGCQRGKRYFFSPCIINRTNFHIDPYGTMSFCVFVKDPALRRSLKKTSVKECWEKFIPSLIKKVKMNKEYFSHCGNCRLEKYCRWCPAFARLEHGRYSAAIKYLCLAAEARKKYEENLLRRNRRYYEVAGVTIRVDSDIPFRGNTFLPKFKKFETKKQGRDTILLKHSFRLPDIDPRKLGKPVYACQPWKIYKKNGAWVYFLMGQGLTDPIKVAIFSLDHCQGRIYHKDADLFITGRQNSLTCFPTDQILLGRILADRSGCFLHSSGVNLNGKGFLFLGHSGAGKSTMLKLLSGRARILCDDRMIVRKINSGFKIYGNWNHGELPDVSRSSVKLRALFFLEKSNENRIVCMENKNERMERVLSCLVKPLVSLDWWEKSIRVIEEISKNVPCYVLKFDRSKKVVGLLSKF